MSLPHVCACVHMCVHVCVCISSAQSCHLCRCLHHLHRRDPGRSHHRPEAPLRPHPLPLPSPRGLWSALTSSRTSLQRRPQRPAGPVWKFGDTLSLPELPGSLPGCSAPASPPSPPAPLAVSPPGTSTLMPAGPLQGKEALWTWPVAACGAERPGCWQSPASRSDPAAPAGWDAPEVPADTVWSWAGAVDLLLCVGCGGRDALAQSCLWTS